MCIYCGTNKYRKIYINHYGSIPVDSMGRTYDIHHIDNNHTNNNLDNLKAVTINEHYNIHYAQGDYAAALRIASRLQLSHKELSKLASIQQNEKVKNKTHHLLSGDIQRKASRKRVAEGTHNLLSEHSHIHDKIKNGSYHMLKQNGGSDIAKQNNKNRFESGTHQNQIKIQCPHCDKIGSIPGMKRYHFDKCIHKTIPINKIL